MYVDIIPNEKANAAMHIPSLQPLSRMKRSSDTLLSRLMGWRSRHLIVESMIRPVKAITSDMVNSRLKLWIVWYMYSPVEGPMAMAMLLLRP